MSTPVKPTVAVPDYDGGSLINLMAELEARLTGTSASPQLHDHLASSIPEAATYVVVLFDGLGNDQLSDPDAAELLAARTAVIDAPFPTTTTVSLASVATGLPPSQHGLLGYQLWIPQTGHVVNTIKWTTLWGDAIDLDTGGFLPSPNLWERVAGAGCEPITAQPIHFETSGLSSVLYRGCRFEGITSLDDMVDATLSLASVPRRLVFAYVPNIDFAAHVFGQDSAGYRDAMRAAATAWERLAQGLPADAVLIGTADHGHVDFPEHKRIHIAKAGARGQDVLRRWTRHVRAWRGAITGSETRCHVGSVRRDAPLVGSGNPFTLRSRRGCQTACWFPRTTRCCSIVSAIAG